MFDCIWISPNYIPIQPMNKDNINFCTGLQKFPEDKASQINKGLTNKVSIFPHLS